MLAIKRAPVTVVRAHVRYNSSLNSLWSWFKRKDQQKEAKTPVLKTKDLVKNIEQQSKQGWEAPAAEKQAEDAPKSFASETAVDLEVIGLPEEQLPLSAEQLQQLGLGSFKLKQAEIEVQAALAKLAEVATAVVGSMDGSLDTLEKRLNLVKQFQESSGIRVPDLIISTVATPQGVASYVEKSLSSKFNYWEPNAIYLDSKDFEGSNVTVLDAREARKARQEAMDELLADAEKFVVEHDAQAFKQALKD
ncbi:hypothetical protein CJU89_5764 [Yarrowia sp. B02]|nr:hypothetical protein CJU89_5764 [Yarrowia sp. B02]